MDINDILAIIKAKPKEKALSNGAFSGYRLLAELQKVQNKDTKVIIALKIPVYDDNYEIKEYTYKSVGSNFMCDSWRGSYDLPAANYTENTSYSVQTIINNITASKSKSVQGWKGGDFTLSMNDVIYIANQGCSNNSTAIVGITESDEFIILQTEPDMY